MNHKIHLPSLAIRGTGLFRSDLAFFLMVVFFQIIFIFQGLDFADEGVYATSYQLIFNAPESLRWGYWLTMVIGGGWLQLFPGLGLLGIRIAGVIITTSTVIVIYYWLKKTMKSFHIRWGILIVLIVLSYQSPTELYYNNISAFFWVISSILIYIGIVKNRLLLVFFSGLAVALNAFARIPNLLGTLIIVAGIIYLWSSGNSLKRTISPILAFLTGFLLTTLVMLLIMHLTDQLQIFVDQVARVNTMAKSNQDKHSIFNLVTQYGIQYSLAVSFNGFILIVSLIYLSISEVVSVRMRRPFELFALISATILIALVLIKGLLSYKIFEFYIIGLAFIVNLIQVLNKSANREIRFLSALGIIMLLCLPFGSGEGLWMAGRYAMWISLPLGLGLLLDSKKSAFSSTVWNPIFSFSPLPHTNNFNLFRVIFILITVAGLYFSTSSPYFDDSPRTQMFYRIPHRSLRGIYTSEERADAVTKLLDASRHYVKPNDFVIAYDNIPMYHYLTHTVPFLGTPWPGIQNPEVFKKYFNIALELKRKLPVVVIQKMNTLDSDWPKNNTEMYNNNVAWNESSNKYLSGKPIRDEILFNFLKQNRYIIVWESETFLIMKSESDTVSPQ